MSMLELRGALVTKKQKKMDLSIRAGALMKTIQHVLATSSITPLAEIDVPGMAASASELLRVYQEHSQVCDDIRKIEKELGE